MSRIENEFKCAYCHRKIEFGDPEARAYDDEIFCDEDCAASYADISYYDWRFESEYEIIEDESNGYGIKLFGDDWFSNGKYIIFDKPDETRFEFDDGYDEYFGVKRGNDVPDTQKFLNIFETRKDEFVTVQDDWCSYERRNHTPHEPDMFDNILDIYVISKYRIFVFNYIANNPAPDEFKAFADDNILYIECKGKRALICGNVEPKDHPERFEKQTIAIPVREYPLHRI